MIFKKLILSIVLGTVALMAFGPGNAIAAKLNYYCSAQEDWCQLMAKGFTKATGIKVNMSRASSGETFAKVKAEAKILRATSGGVEPVIRICRQLKKG